jgi:hypothetical protein
MFPNQHHTTQPTRTTKSTQKKKLKFHTHAKKNQNPNPRPKTQSIQILLATKQRKFGAECRRKQLPAKNSKYCNTKTTTEVHLPKSTP